MLNVDIVDKVKANIVNVLQYSSLLISMDQPNSQLMWCWSCCDISVNLSFCISGVNVQVLQTNAVMLAAGRVSVP